MLINYLYKNRKMETKKELQKEIDKYRETSWNNWQEGNSLEEFYFNVKNIVARMPDDKSETKPEPSLLEVAMSLYGLLIYDIKQSFDSAEKLIAENERRKNGK